MQPSQPNCVRAPPGYPQNIPQQPLNYGYPSYYGYGYPPDYNQMSYENSSKEHEDLNHNATSAYYEQSK